MARTKGRRGPNQMTTIELRQALKTPGLHSDGGGLYLRVGTHGRQQSWLAIYHWHGRRREIGLGSADSVSLALAREKASAVRVQVATGIDPIEAKRAERAIPTFGAVADDWIKLQEPKITSDKSVARLKRALGENGYLCAWRPDASGLRISGPGGLGQ